MNEDLPSQGPAGVKFLFWRTTRGLAVAICLALYAATAVCVVMAMEGPDTNRWLYPIGLVLAAFAGAYNHAILRADRFGG